MTLRQELEKFSNEAVCPVVETCVPGFMSGAYWGWGEARNEISRILKRNGQEGGSAELAAAIRWLLGVVKEHEIESLDCDRRGEKYCSCMSKAIEYSERALNNYREKQ